VTAAGSLAVAAGIVALISGILLGAFFATGREWLGRANDATSALFMVMLIPAALVLGDRLGALQPWWFGAATVIGLLGLGAGIIFSILAAMGRLSITQLTRYQGGAFGVVLVWVGLISEGGIRHEVLPSGLGWLGLGTVLAGAVAVITLVRLARRAGSIEALGRMDRPPPLAAAATLTALLGFPAWCVWLGFSL
jgi:hypothetical protein